MAGAEAFQLLGRAYETLKDESKRRTYDFIYPSISRSRPSPQTAETPRPPPGSTPQSKTLSEEAEIAALEKSKHERSARWKAEKNHLDSLISRLLGDIQQLEHEIYNLNSIVAVEEEVEEAQNNNWGTWLMSPIFKKSEDSEEEKARKERVGLERKLEKDMKERRLGWRKADLKKEVALLQTAKEEVDAADLVDDRKIQVLQDTIRASERREREEREMAVRAAVQKRAWEVGEALRKKQAEGRAAEQAAEQKRAKQVWEAAEALRKKQAEEQAAEQAAKQKRAKEVWEAAEALRKKQEAERAAEQKRAQEAEEVEKRRKKQAEEQAAEQKRIQEAEEVLRKQQAEERAVEQKLAQEAEEVEKRRKQQAEERAAEQKREVERAKRPQKVLDDNTQNVRKPRANCPHDDWWPKVEGRKICPRCPESWAYLLQCPDCKMKACPKCQYYLRRSYRGPRNVTSTNGRASPSSDYSHDNDKDTKTATTDWEIWV